MFYIDLIARIHRWVIFVAMDANQPRRFATIRRESVVLVPESAAGLSWDAFDEERDELLFSATFAAHGESDADLELHVANGVQLSSEPIREKVLDALLELAELALYEHGFGWLRVVCQDARADLRAVLTESGFEFARALKVGGQPGARYRANRASLIRAYATMNIDHYLPHQGWRFDFDNGRRRAGLCNYTDKLITVSKYHVATYTADETFQVILHEIAHAMCGPKAGHGKKWLSTAKSIGYRAEKFTGKEIAENYAPWVGACPGGHEHFRYRKPTRAVSCSICHPSYSRAYLIEWTKRD